MNRPKLYGGPSSSAWPQSSQPCRRDDELSRFLREFDALPPDQQARFYAALANFIDDLPVRRFRRSLRVKGVSGFPGIFEMTWAPDGRATFEYGARVLDDEPHIVWRRVGKHEIFDDP